jgi:hypothetical protein
MKKIAFEMKCTKTWRMFTGKFNTRVNEPISGYVHPSMSRKSTGETAQPLPWP